MKKNKLLIISICLSIILLGVCVYQGFQISTMKSESKIVEDFFVHAFDMNIEEWKLEAAADAALTHWSPDMKVTLIAEFDGKTVSVPMEHTYDNRYSARFFIPLSLPLNHPNLAMYKIQVEENGKVTQQDVYAQVDTFHLWADTIHLLGLYSSGGDISGPYYEDGVVTGDFSIRLENLSGSIDPGPILDPYFEVFKNGELVQTLEAVQEGDWSISNTCTYKIKDDIGQWNLEAAEGDQIVIRFRCHGEYRLGWDFHLYSFEIRNGEACDADQNDEPDSRFFRVE